MILVCTLWLFVLLFELAQPGFYNRMAVPIWLVTLLIALGEMISTTAQQAHERELKKLEFSEEADESPTHVSTG